MKYKIKIILFLLIVIVLGVAQKKITDGSHDIVIARLKYDGGGDWYADPSSLPNLIKFANSNAPLHIAKEEKRVGIMDKDFFNYPYLYLTGHGNISFSREEIKRLRQHLQNGGFLHVDDNYGLDKSFRREIKKFSLTMKWLNYLITIRFFMFFMNFLMGCPKFMNMTTNQPRVLGFFITEGWSFFIPMNAIWVMGGKTRRCIMTRLLSGTRL